MVISDRLSRSIKETRELLRQQIASRFLLAMRIKVIKDELRRSLAVLEAEKTITLWDLSEFDGQANCFMADDGLHFILG